MSSIVVGRDRIIRWMSPELVDIFGDRTGHEWGTNREAMPDEVLAEQRAYLDRALAGEWVSWRSPVATGVMIPAPGGVLVSVCLTPCAAEMVRARLRLRPTARERLAAAR